MERLSGGRTGVIYRNNDKAHRPSGFWSESIKHLLLHLRNVGFTAAPCFCRFDNDGNEALSYVEELPFDWPHCFITSIIFCSKAHESISPCNRFICQRRII